MAGDFDGIKQRNFGIEIEMTGITRCQAANAISKILGGVPCHEGGSYDRYTVRDGSDRTWSLVYDGSIEKYNEYGKTSSLSYSVELNSPVLGYDDIPLLQEVIRALRAAGGVTGPKYCCGTHLHISADDFTPRQLINLVNIFSSKEDFLWDALQVSTARANYCQKISALSIDMTQKGNYVNRYGIIKVEVLWSGAKRNGKGLQLSALAKSFSCSN